MMRRLRNCRLRTFDEAGAAVRLWWVSAWFAGKELSPPLPNLPADPSTHNISRSFRRQNDPGKTRAESQDNIQSP